MGLFDGLLGNASEVDLSEVEKELSAIVVSGESVQKAYKVLRDMFVFTNKRLILIDKQGITGKKTEYHSIPYKSITHFGVETAGTFDTDAELKIFITGQPMPLTKEFRKDKNIFDVQKTLATFIL